MERATFITFVGEDGCSILVVIGILAVGRGAREAMGGGLKTGTVVVVANDITGVCPPVFL